MKRLLAKLVRTKPSTESSSRITNDTVAEHREKILAGGRKFKYPLQYAKHKLVINTVIISAVSVIGLVSVGLWQLYSVQNTSEFMYKITQVIPLPVASVNGESVPYSDYLMRYRSAEHYLAVKEQVDLNSEDGKVQVDTIKQKAMEDAVSYAYSRKLAKSLDISVSDTELESFLKSQRQYGQGEVSQQTYDSVMLDYYNWSPDEYRHDTKAKLLKQKVSYAVDNYANDLVSTISTKLAQDSTLSLKTIADSTPAAGSVTAQFVQSGRLPKTNQDGGLTDAASKLSVGSVSSSVKTISADAFYFVKLTFSNDTQVEYDYIKIPLTVFSSNLDGLKSKGDIKYYITLKEVEQ